VTSNTLKRLVRSIAFRRRLLEDLPNLEAELRAFMQSQDLKQIAIGGYKARLNGGDITLERFEVDRFKDQLEFEFQKFQDKRSDPNERKTRVSNTA